MIVLFIHQNFPGQYKHLVRHFADRGDRVLFITQPNANAMRGVEKIVYDPRLPKVFPGHPLAADFDQAVRVGMAVGNTCRELKARALQPSIIFGHNGWGEMIFVKDIFPDVPVLSYFEFYYHSQNVDVGFDAEYESDVDPLRLRTRNAINLLGFDVADWGNTPTLWQRQVHPPEFRSRLTVIHEGVDTDEVAPDPDAWLYLDAEDLLLNAQTELITYVARNLEPYRGFHVFMRSLARVLQRRPKAHVAVVGGDDVSYGSASKDGATFKALMLAELGSKLDLSRVHFLGKIDYDNYIRLLQISSVHVYLTYPFVLSWSFLEAMACGCAVVGSDTPPVIEVLKDRRNGLICDFFSPDDVAEKVEELLEDRGLAARLGQAARKTIVEGYDLKARQLPAWDRLTEDLLEGRRPPLMFAPPVFDSEDP